MSTKGDNKYVNKRKVDESNQGFFLQNFDDFI